MKVAKQVTLDELKKSMPSKKAVITQEAVDIINQAQSEPEFQGESLLQTAITYERILNNTKASIKEYLKALKFCAYLISMDDNYTEAYKKTFSERDFVRERLDASHDGVPYKELTSAASRYRRSKLVTEILTLSQVPLDLMFTGARYKAIGVLAEVMETARFDRDKINAAKELLAATKGPENIKMELDIGIKQDSSVAQLNEQLAELAGKQMEHLQNGRANLGQLGALKPKNEEDIEDAEVVNG